MRKAAAETAPLEFRDRPSDGERLCPGGRAAEIPKAGDPARNAYYKNTLDPPWRGLSASASDRKRTAYLAPKRIERLNSDIPARLHPRPGRMLDRRANMELALKRSLIVARRAKIAQFEKDVGES
jgi:hypothetical protein